MQLSRKLWELDHYKVPVAGRKIKMSRSASYRAAEDGLIPTVEDNGFLWVPKKPWDRIAKQILRGRIPPRPQATQDKAVTTEETA